MIKRMMEFKDRVGITREKAMVVDFLKEQMTLGKGKNRLELKAERSEAAKK